MALSQRPAAWRPPVFIIYSLVSRSYVLDLSPDNTFVGRLLNAGLDVFLIDWGVPDEKDADNTFETYVDYYLPQAIKALLAEAGADGLTVLGYCSGGDLALFLTARHPELPIRNLITVGTPVNFSRNGHVQQVVQRRPARCRVAASTPLATFRRRACSTRSGYSSPLVTSSSYVMLWQNLWSDEQMAAYQAMGQWTKDHVPFPGGTFRQLTQMMRDNAIINDTVLLGGTPVHLADIRCPFLSVLAERDHIAPEASVAPVVRLVGSEDVEEVRLPAGHVGLMASRTAVESDNPRDRRLDLPAQRGAFVKLVPASEVPPVQLSEFFARIPDGEQAFLKENVRDPGTVAAWRRPAPPRSRHRRHRDGRGRGIGDP